MWMEDHKSRQLLEQIGIKFEYRKNIPISSLNLDKSKRLNARFDEPIDKEMCERYSYQMKQGIVFPCVTIHGNLLLAGNNRVCASQMAGRTVVDGYVVLEATEAQRDEFVRRDNTTHGKGLSHDELIRQCVELNLRHNTPITELNRNFFGGSENTYSQICVAKTATEVAAKLNARGIDVSKISSRSALSTLNKISDNTNVLVAAGQIVSEYDLSIDQSRELANKIEKEETEKDKVRVCSEFKKALHERVVRGKNRPETNFRKGMNSLHKFLMEGNEGGPWDKLSDLFVDDKEERSEWIVKINEAIDALKNLKAK